MLQQTQVKTVIPYYLKFMQFYPDVNTLAQAELDEVLHLWSGLGYYARARNLHKTAQIIQSKYSSHFPDSSELLQSLPGIGRSTAGAILSFAKGQHHAILDGNVKRILTRHYLVKGWVGQTKTQKKLWSIIDQITPEQDCDNFNQALMDLGSSLCSRSKPQCPQCPLNTSCKAYKNELTYLYPTQKPKKIKPEKSCYLLMIISEHGEILLEQQPDQGIWGGLWSFPQCQTVEEIGQWMIKHQHTYKSKIQFDTPFRHSFTHYHLQIHPVKIQLISTSHSLIQEKNNFIWYEPAKPLKLGMPTPIKNLISDTIKTSPFFRRGTEGVDDQPFKKYKKD